jgi:hypothetical protein
VQDVGTEVALPGERVTTHCAVQSAGAGAAQVDVAYAEAVQDVGTELDCNAERHCQIHSDTAARSAGGKAAQLINQLQCCSEHGGATKGEFCSQTTSGEFSTSQTDG